jgi:YD repeat-containing protein
VTDEAGNARVNTVDGLGRLSSVQEANGTLTWYTYDGLNNLTWVSMGVQTRTFTYSSLSRLLSATNPETGTTPVTYAS